MDLRQLFLFAGVVLPIAAALPYIIDTYKGRTHPNLVTWFTWLLLTLINTVAVFYAGYWQTGIFSLTVVLCIATIILFGLRDGFKKYTRFDIVCQVLALIGIGIWLLTNDPFWAVVVVVVVDLLAGLPTIRHAWLRPWEETWLTFGLSSIGATCIVLSQASIEFVAVGYPAYIAVFDALITTIILYRGSVWARKTAQASGGVRSRK